MLSIRILSIAGSSWVVYLYFIRFIHGSGWNFVISSASFRSVSVHLDPSVDRVGIDIRRAPGTQQVQNLELRVRKSWRKLKIAEMLKIKIRSLGKLILDDFGA